MENSTYIYRSDAIEREIIQAIEAGDDTCENYDIDAIADAVIGVHDGRFYIAVNEGDFWRIVKDNAK